MLRIRADQFAELERLCFFGRMRRFIAARCGQPALRRWAAANPDPSVWREAWPRVRLLSEHDAALLLVFIAVRTCEYKSIRPAEAMAEHLPQHEVRVKRFLAKHGYFAFSDFDVAASAGA